MALSVKVGSFVANTGTGNQAVTGVGFQPKALILMGNQLTADGSHVDANFSIGWTAGTAGRSMSFISDDSAATSASMSQRSLSRIFEDFDSNGVSGLALSFVSFGADGFTVNVDATTGPARIVNYFAIGGADLTNAKIGEFDTRSTAGSQSVTGVGFQPDCLIFVSHIASRIGFGFTSGSTEEGGCGFTSVSGQTTMNTARYQRTNRCICMPDNNASILHEAELTSFDSDGFTLNWIDADGARPAIYLALKGGSYFIGSDTQKTSTGTKATTGVGFTPKGLWLASFNNVAATTVQAHNRITHGWASGTSSRVSLWEGDTNGIADAVADHNLDRANVLKMMTEGTPSTEAAADLSSFDSDGFTLNWGTADATAREFIFLAMGDTPVAGGAARIWEIGTIYPTDGNADGRIWEVGPQL